jgi:hypothetical protein
MSTTMLFDIVSAFIALGLVALWLVVSPAEDEGDSLLWLKKSRRQSPDTHDIGHAPHPAQTDGSDRIERSSAADF